jgi:hypothetical protein
MRFRVKLMVMGFGYGYDKLWHVMVILISQKRYDEGSD